MENHAKERPNHEIVTYGLDGKSSLSHGSFHVDDDAQTALGSVTTSTREWYQYNVVRLNVCLADCETSHPRCCFQIWDAPMVHGCVCDHPWTGYDCSQRECPRGDDPLTTGQRDAVQLIECNTTFRTQYLKLHATNPTALDSGSFALRYGGEYTRPMAHNATADTLRKRLRALAGVGDDDTDDDVSKGVQVGGAGGGVRVAVTDGGTSGVFVAKSWNLTFADASEQAPLVPLYKQPEVQVCQCAADRGFLTLRYPAPWPTGSKFSGICLGGTLAGKDCMHSDDCVGGTRTGEGTKCGPKTFEEVKLKFDATQAETVVALQSFSLIDRVAVNFSDTSSEADNNKGGKGLGGGKFCTPGGNTVTVTFLHTRLDVLEGGDVPPLKSVAGDSLRRQSTPVSNLEGSAVLTPTWREIIKGVDSCSREEVQTFTCLASGGSMKLQLVSPLLEFSGTKADDDTDDGSGGAGRLELGDDDGNIATSSTSWVTVAWDATQAELKAALENLPLVENVTVAFSGNALNGAGEYGDVPVLYSDGGSLCSGSEAHKVIITFHALSEGFAHRLSRVPGGGRSGGTGGDLPELVLDGTLLTHDTAVALSGAAATEAVKGLACEPLGTTYVIGERDDDGPEVTADRTILDDDDGCEAAGPVRCFNRKLKAFVGEQPPQMVAGVAHPNQDGGEFSLGLLGEATAPISASATREEVAAALNALPTLKGNVAVSFSRQHACQAPANVMAVTFLSDFGVSQAKHRTGAHGRATRAALPPLSVDRSRMPSSAGVGRNGTWAPPHISVHVDGASDSTGTYASQNGTKENDVCSNHGICGEATGVCDCFSGQDFGHDHAFGSSNGRGAAGGRGDCGFEVAPRGDPRSVWHIGGRGGGATVKSAYNQAQQMVHEQSWGLDFPTTDCPGAMACSGHGHCSGPPAYRCTCAEGWEHAADCSERECPRAPAWFDYPMADNDAHDKRGGGVECGGRGLCDRDGGECQCQSGFTGSACQFTECPGRELMRAPGKRGTGGGVRGAGLGGNGGGRDCSGHGRCLNMRQMAHLSATPRGDAAFLAYGEDPNNPFTWDGERLRGCYCDEAYTGADCSERTCPFGDDPNTHDDVAEVQLLNCTATGGEFTLSFRSIVDSGSGTRVTATTAHLPHNASATRVKAALEALSTIEEVEVKYSSDAHDTFCLGGREYEEVANASAREVNVVSVRFVKEGGDLPSLVPGTAALVDDPYGDLDEGSYEGSGRVYVAHGGVSMHGFVSVAGSREHKECSGRGVCDRSTGICDCFPGYASGDANNANARGERSDCGYLVGDRLLRVRGGRGDSDPLRAHGLEDAGREGGSSGNGGHQLGGSYPVEKSMELLHGPVTSAGVPGEGDENLPASAQDLLDHVAANVHLSAVPSFSLRGAGRRLLGFLEDTIEGLLWQPHPSDQGR